MGQRGIERPIYKPQGTQYQFEWPMGISRGQRDYLVRKAKEACDDDPIRVVLWLQRNTWKHVFKFKNDTPVQGDQD
jgi:hypothetical protein